MGYGDGIRRRTRRRFPDLVHRHAGKLILGDAALAVTLCALGKYLSR